MKKLLLLFCLIGSTAFAQVQPQFKFYLAFEDATGARDTVWLFLDSTCTNLSIDTLFGDSLLPCDTNKFNLNFMPELQSGNLSLKTMCLESDDYGWSPNIYSIKAVNPIVIRWDTHLLKDNNLGYALKQAWIYSDNFLAVNGYPYGLDLFESDSIYLPSFLIGGGEGSHFPVSLTISPNPRTNWWGIPERNKIGHTVIPNPVSDKFYLKIEPQHLISSLQLFNHTGQNLTNCLQILENNLFDLSNLPAGLYFLTFNINNQIHHEKIIKN